MFNKREFKDFYTKEEKYGKRQFSLTTIRNVVDNWKASNQPEDNGRYTKKQLQSLDTELAGYISEVVEAEYTDKFNPSIKKMYIRYVFYSYHLVRYVLDCLGANVDFTYNINDYNTYTVSDANGRVNAVKGLSITVKYTSDILQEQKTSIPLAVMNSKMETEINPTADDIDFTIKRSLVKTLAENTGFGDLCWLNPEFVKHKYHENRCGFKTSEYDTETGAQPVVEQPKPKKTTKKAEPKPEPVVEVPQPVIEFKPETKPQDEIIDELMKELKDDEDSFEDLISPAVKQQEEQANLDEIKTKFMNEASVRQNELATISSDYKQRYGKDIGYNITEVEFMTEYLKKWGKL